MLRLYLPSQELAVVAGALLLLLCWRGRFFASAVFFLGMQVLLAKYLTTGLMHHVQAIIYAVGNTLSTPRW